MAESLKITIAQLNATVGDLDGNCAKAVEAWEAAKAADSDMVALPEMFVTGYQTQDLILKPAFYNDAESRIETLAKDCADGPAMAIGAPHAEGDALYNAYFILEGGAVKHILKKQELPNAAVFDEVRLFTPAEPQEPFEFKGFRIGAPICEDIWHERVPADLAAKGAEFFLVPNGSPYHVDKMDLRYRVVRQHEDKLGVPMVYINLVGGQDDQVFDGGSFVIGGKGTLRMQMVQFEEQISEVTLTRKDGKVQVEQGEVVDLGPSLEQDYHAMVKGLRDYLGKTGFKKVLLGLSGGVDSAIVAAIASDAIGPQNVRTVMMPSEYTSEHSLEDAAAVADHLGTRLDTINIEAGRQAIMGSLAPLFEGTKPDVTEENIQSRLRGLYLMALSNKFGEMLLTTGNKSEVAVGYATIYGDMAGGYNPLKDMYKSRVFKSCHWRNENHRDWMMGPEGRVIPERVITKPPSAELREDQKDEDSLPPYEDLDQILHGLVEADLSVAEIVAQGFERETVKKVERLLYLSEYKRFQAAPGPRLTPKSFWMDRRYPIIMKWRDNS
ncbi:NAD+ synthase [Paracoccaceae bacterium GXU_MW_L88]